jgi:hypothetical protein
MPAKQNGQAKTDDRRCHKRYSSKPKLEKGNGGVNLCCCFPARRTAIDGRTTSLPLCKLPQLILNPRSRRSFIYVVRPRNWIVCKGVNR